MSFLVSLLAELFYEEPRVVHRETGDDVHELVPVGIKVQLGVLYNTYLGNLLSKLPWLRHYQLRHSQQLGWRYDSPASRHDIPGFVKDYGVCLDELEKPLDEYQTLNEFFSRMLRPGARPIHRPTDGAWAVQPADARCVVFPAAQSAQQLWVKARSFSLQQLLGAQPPGSQHSILISRLAPDDYHRFHSPVAGNITAIISMGRELFSVKAIAVNSPVDVLCENRRVAMRLESPAFGTMWVVAVGACQVGSVQLSVGLQQAVAKGQELGWFAYGGSSVVTVFDAARVRLDDDLVERSRHSVETLVRMGTSLGRAA